MSTATSHGFKKGRTARARTEWLRRSVPIAETRCLCPHCDSTVAVSGTLTLCPFCGGQFSTYLDPNGKPQVASVRRGDGRVQTSIGFDPAAFDTHGQMVIIERVPQADAYFVRVGSKTRMVPAGMLTQAYDPRAAMQAEIDLLCA